MQIIDLFSGIGGFSLAGHWAGWRTVQFVEINEACHQVLRHHFPGVPIHNDVKTFGIENLKKNELYDPAEPTIVVGGFPCQPFSVAGQRKGKEDERHLWPEMRRIIREVRPDWIVGENVYGLVNWNEGVVFDEVCADLENEGFEVWPIILPAAGVGAPHKRDRIWFIAKNTMRDGRPFGEPVQKGTTFWQLGDAGSGSRDGLHREPNARTAADANHEGGSREPRSVSEAHGEISQWDTDAQPGNTDYESAAHANNTRDRTSTSGVVGDRTQGGKERQHALDELGRPRHKGDATHAGLLGQEERQEQPMGPVELRQERDAPHTGNAGLQGGELHGTPDGGGWRSKSPRAATQLYQIENWEQFPTVSPVCDGNDGLSLGLVGITFPKWRKQSIMQLGNSIVPQVAYNIFLTINEFNENHI